MKICSNICWGGRVAIARGCRPRVRTDSGGASPSSSTEPELEILVQWFVKKSACTEECSDEVPTWLSGRASHW